MSEIILSKEARKQLATFVDTRAPGTPYRRRATILLLADEGQEPPLIGSKVGLPVAQVRLLCDAFERQGMSYFPSWVAQEHAPFTSEMDLAEAGRIALARQLGVIEAYDPALRKQGSADAVHETRKAIRRSRTLFQLLKPCFVKGTFRPFRRCLKETMRHLGRARDLHVFLVKLDRYREQQNLSAAEQEALSNLRQSWQEAKDVADEAVCQAAQRKAYRKCLEAYQLFTGTFGAGVPAKKEPFEPRQVRYQAAVHIYRRLAAVRVFDEYLSSASVYELHQLRIRFKELRYTLEFFAPVLGREIETVLADLNQIQDHLGDLNDAQTALTLLDETEGAEAGVRCYRTAQEAELTRLVDTFGPVWDTFNAVAWRERLATALSVI